MDMVQIRTLQSETEKRILEVTQDLQRLDRMSKNTPPVLVAFIFFVSTIAIHLFRVLL